MYTKPLPTQDFIAKTFIYDPETGDLRWRVRHTHTCAKGVIDQDGSLHGYRVVTYRMQTWLQHRLIWKLMTGEDPDPRLALDHKNENPGDNRWCNLQQVSLSENITRSSKHLRQDHMQANILPHGRWQARWYDGTTGKSRHVGVYDTEAEALAADHNNPPPRLRARGPLEPGGKDGPTKARKTKSGRWEARAAVIGGNKWKHIGTFDTREQALAVRPKLT